jgi:hypothetical protein
MIQLIKKFLLSGVLIVGFFMTSTLWAYIMLVVLKKLRVII